MAPESKKRVRYTTEKLNEALNAVRNGLPVNTASKKFGIPKTTLRDKRSGKYKNKKCGVQPILTSDEEQVIVH